MASYSYRCSNVECGDERDLVAPMRDRDAWQGKACTTCDNGTLKRVFTPFSVLNAGLGDIL
jgi:predicted nucleic acid-binding Zn ribbon protein